MPIQRFIVDIDYDPIDCNGELNSFPDGTWDHIQEDLSDWMECGIEITAVAAGGERLSGNEENEARDWHDSHCDETECCASDSVIEKYPCSQYKEEAGSEDNLAS